MTTIKPPDIYQDRSQYPDRTLMWMQPAPAHHLGPMRMRLREPVGTNPLCRVASHALFGPWMTQRIATGAERADSTKNHRRHKHNLPNHAEKSASSRGQAALPSRRIRVVHTPSPSPRPGKSISRNAAPSDPHQIGRSRGWRSLRPGTSHALSRITLAPTGKHSHGMVPEPYIITEPESS